ncbi:unnamed protein product [Peronospora belbahrii]|uniref:Uncharacterized protein n=1 Tax=Peronospora belbahrii TaxID=622444 RepID=A0AAU9L8H3_9STRA|nr:unnamed protein product [Peronospora belbahrii]CAH0481916.1 unnamed protein product [Peronospora belbahrii]CAH0514338.1 unnamed protein product [Peronospora belbahrii]
MWNKGVCLWLLLRFSLFRAQSRVNYRTMPMLPRGTFEGKATLITDGDMGLGKGIATKLSDLGAIVAIMSRKRNVVNMAAQEIQELTGDKVTPLIGDVSDINQVKNAVDEQNK